jgi:7-cyano-7-deazaguanine synthase
MHDSVAIVSGGLDSTTLVYHMVDEGFAPLLLSFDYGQRHKKELEYAEATARRLKLDWKLVDLTGLTDLIGASGSSLVSGTDVPDGHYAEESMKQTVVPNRNMIMLSIAGGVAVAEGAARLSIGVHAGDHFIYPDCRPGFISTMYMALVAGNEGFIRKDFLLSAPFLFKTKADIAYRAVELDVPLHLTWSCYKGDNIHCGRCGTCVERLEAFDEVNAHDKTEYADAEFWKEQVKV